MIYSVTVGSTAGHSRQAGQTGFAIASFKAEELASNAEALADKRPCKSATCISSSPLKASESFNLALTSAEFASHPAIASSLTAISFAEASNEVSNDKTSSDNESISACKLSTLSPLFDTMIN